MSVSFTLSASQVFPAGTVVGAYERRQFGGPPPVQGQPAPAGALVATATVTSHGLAVFSNLEPGTQYFAGAQVAGVWRWVQFGTFESNEETERLRAEAAEARLEALIRELGGAGPGSGTGGGKEPPPPPPPTEEASPPPNGPGGNATAGALLFGINSNSSRGHAAMWTSWKVFGDRSDNLDWDFAASPAEVSAGVGASIAAGCKPLLIINTPDSEVLGKISGSAYAAGALAIIERVLKDHPTVTTFQLMNEPYYKGSSPHGSKIGSNGSVYGEIVRLTYEAVKAAGLLSRVTLLVEAFGEYNAFSGKITEENQEQSGIFKHWCVEVIEALKDPTGMVVGDSSTAYTRADQTKCGREEAFQFTARKSGPVKELRFRTNAVANPGVTGVVLGVAADEGGKPGAILGQATYAAEPPVSSWIRAELATTLNLTEGTKYWLMVLPLGPSTAFLHFNAKALEGLGTGDVESKPENLTVITQEAAGEWNTFNQGPVGFQAGTELQHSLAALIGGWSNHPYGNLGPPSVEGNFNWGSTEGFRIKIAELGAGGNNNWWFTEFGWKTAGQQAEFMLGFLEKCREAHAAGWLTAIFAYDDGVAGWTLYPTAAGATFREFASAHG